jgi:diacylglycerol kinase (ATP)
MSAGEAGIRPTDAIRVTGLGLSHATIEDLNHNGTSVGEPEEHVRWVAGAVSAGIDAAINERANKMLRPRGSSRYVIAALRELAAYRAWHYKLTFEHVVIRQDDDGGKQWFGRVLDMPGMTDLGPEPDGDGHRLQWISPGALVTAANAPQIGGGIFVAPKASMDDGLMDIVLAGDVGRSGASVLFPQMLSGGKHIHSNAVRIVRAKALTIESADGAEKLPTCFGDGEHLGTTPLRAELRPHALKILVPPQNP